MPIYEYHCQHCGQRVSIHRSFSEASSPQCPICGSENLTRLISPVSIVKSGKDRIRDLSWIDKDVARRLKKKSHGRLGSGSKETLDTMESE